MNIDELNKTRDKLNQLNLYSDNFRIGWDKAVETLWPEIERLKKERDGHIKISLELSTLLRKAIDFRCEEMSKTLEDYNSVRVHIPKWTVVSEQEKEAK